MLTEAEFKALVRQAEEGSISPAGLAALEPYRVRRAVILAAGFGSRMVPVTLKTPKPLVRVHGTQLIETMLDALLAAGIDELWLVRGYLGEQFDQLLDKYPMLHFLENPYYQTCNSISSALAAAEYLPGSYIVEGDFLVKNPAVIQPYQYRSNYLGVYQQHTDDWCLKTENGIATQMVLGGDDCYLMYGVSYWTPEDGARLAGHLKQMWDLPGGRQEYYDCAVFDHFPEQYQITVRPCAAEDILEIDTYEELCRLDESYLAWADTPQGIK